MSDDYIRVGEFERFTDLILGRIDEGFRETKAGVETTQALQRQTNGRVNALEAKVEVISKARLIDRVQTLEQERAGRDAVEAALSKRQGRSDAYVFAAIAAVASLVSAGLALIVEHWKA